MSTFGNDFKQEFDLQYEPKDIGKYIVKLRKSRKLSICQLALRSGMKEPVLLRVEKGRADPRLSTLLKIIRGLEMSVADFFKVFKKY
ncbi:MAG: helix-turn-helix domain-containing protein [Candidatus Margulisbacteria bacterium]|jgi:transcriptional regulator with XRE-family HTH domain|nr:helix-turn-helix domain-containing protein [Candidatus Margulisiibacteriota bacterium]